MTRNFIFAAALGVALMAGPAAAAELKVHGSSTVATNVVTPNKAAIEKETGLTLAVVPNGSGNGLKDLVAGKADVAMISAELKTEVDGANKTNPGSLDASGLVVNPIGSIVSRIIVNPNNPAKNLTTEQVKDIFTGKIASWKDVGGADQPILVVVEQPGNGGRAVLTSILLGGAEITAKARPMNAIAQVAQVVAQAPNAIGYGSAATISSAVAVVQGVEVRQPLSIITKGAPGADAKKFIEAAAKHSPK